MRAEALVCRNYARYYDEHEHEFPPDELPEAKDFPNSFAYLAGRDDLDIGMGVMSMLISAGQTWGDYSVRMRRGKRRPRQRGAARGGHARAAEAHGAA